VILTAIVGTSVFAALQRDFGTAARIGVALLTVGAAVTSAVHTFAGLAERKSSYEIASRRHAAVRHRIGTIRARIAVAQVDSDIWQEIDAIKAKMDDVAASNPNASARIWDRTRRQMKAHFTRGEKSLGVADRPATNPDWPNSRSGWTAQVIV
jgi:hypothetical protein